MSSQSQAPDSSTGLGVLYGVGVGPGDPQLMTIKGQQVLGDVAAVFAPKSKGDGDSLALNIAQQYVGHDAQVSELLFPMTSDSVELDKAWSRAADSVLEYLRRGEDAAFITLGDPSTYSTFSYLVRAVHSREADIEVRVIPGVTSFAAAAAMTSLPLVEGSDSLKVLPLVTDADLDRLDAETGAVVFLKAGKRTTKILEALRRTGRIDSASVARRLGMEGESVRGATAFEQTKETADEYLTIVLSPATTAKSDIPSGGRKRGKVHFIGAGPGAPDLITMRGAAVLAKSPVVIYAGSLVNPEILRHAASDADVHNSASMDLEEIIEVMTKAAKEGHDVARVHTGDPALYGAIQEQISELKSRDIEYEIVPGVTSLFAAAGTLGRELTQPELAQTVIISRIEGRTPVPGTESLASLAAHQASLALYLSVGSIERVVGELSVGYPLDTPAAVVYRASWPDEQIVEGTLGDIAHKVKAAGITKTALILVGRFLKAEGRKSKLYDAEFTHEYRDGKRSSDDQLEQDREVIEPAKTDIAVAALTAKGVESAVKVADALRSTGRSASVYAPASRHEREDVEQLAGASDLPVLLRNHDALIAVMALGIVVRTVGPELREKRTDGAVVVVDEALGNVISVAGGHIGGANQLTIDIAEALDANPVITTASDTRDVPAIDMVLKDKGLEVDDHTSLTALAADILAGKTLDVHTDRPLDAGKLMTALEPVVSNLEALPEDAGSDLAEDSPDNGSVDIIITDSSWHLGTPERTVVRPRSIVAGVGCRKGVTGAEVLSAIKDCCAESEISIASLSVVSTIDIKRDEQGLLEAAGELGVGVEFVTSSQIVSVSDQFTASEAVLDRIGVGGVAEPAALLISSGKLIAGKSIYGPVTVALARRPDGEGIA